MESEIRNSEQNQKFGPTLFKATILEKHKAKSAKENKFCE